MFSSETATVDNSIGRLLPDQQEQEPAEAAHEALEKMSIGSSTTEDVKDERSPSPKQGDKQVVAVHMAQSAQNPESLNFLQDRLTEKPFTSQSFPVSDTKWTPSALAAPRGMRPVDIGVELESTESNPAPRLESALYMTLRDASSPEIDTDISRTSSTIILRGEHPKNDRASSEIDDKTVRLKVKRLHSIFELLDTESNYTDDLDLLVNVFFVELQSVPYFCENPQRLRTVVRNANQLLDLHREMTAKLRSIVEGATSDDAPNDSADHAVVECANTIASLAPQFKVYNQFCARHKEALAHIDAAESRTGEWEMFRQRSAEAANRYLAKSSTGETLSASAPSPRVLTQRRLLFRDFFIKPIQRVCLYPIILQTIQKNSPNVGQEELARAIDLMRKVTLDVDSASKQRESALLTEMIGSRLEMSGNLDVLHHHPTQAPLSTPLPIKYYGCFLFADFLLIVKVRRNHMFTARYWFPLAEARLERSSAHESYLPHSFRLTVRGHFFEFIALTAKECQLWLNALEEVMKENPSRTRRLNGADVLYPCNLSSDGSASAQDGEDPLVAFFGNRASVPDTQAARGRSTTASSHGEILLRHKSPPRRAAIDRGMLFSDACISARTSFDNDGVLSHAMPAAPSSLGSTMGAIVNLSRLSGSETVSLKLPSRAVPSDGTTPTQTPHISPVLISTEASPVESPIATAPSSPTLRPSFFFPDDGAEPQGRGFRRRMRDSFSRRSSVQLDANDIIAIRDQAAAQSLSRRGSQVGLDTRAVQVNELGQTVQGPGPLTVDTSSVSSVTNTPRATNSFAHTMRNPKKWFSPTTPRPSSATDESDPWLAGDTVPSGTLKRSSSLNWSALRAKNWSTISLKSLATRGASVELERPMPDLESRPPTALLSDASRSSSALSNHADMVSPGSSRAPSPKRKFALRFLQLGALYAFVLQRGGARITAVCRSNYETVKEKGINVISEKYGSHMNWRPDQVVRSPEEVKDTKFDYVVCAFKAVPDMRPSSETIRPFLEKNLSLKPSKLPMVVLIQNGVDIENELHDSLVKCDQPLASGVVGGVTWVGATLLGEGTRIEHGLMEKLKIGLYPPPLDEELPKDIAAEFDQLVSLFAKGDSDVEGSNDIVGVRWSKVLWNISWGGLSTLARQPVAALLQAETLPYTCGVVHGIMLELIAIARAHGISEKRLPASTVDHVYNLTMKSTYVKVRTSRDPDHFVETKPGTYLPFDFKPSILVDLERERPMELQTIFGTLLQRAREANVDTPRLDTIVAALMPSQIAFVCKSKGVENKFGPESDDGNKIYDANPALNKTGGAPVLDP
ncbi:2-dehydropantoate 2-reductase [Malassezia obtusa]|uniref:2-dehydropantoate 2-reductase n=1 Tax=Malassezia obtusa TaxID=76774 RepID=A0AAF0IVA9_9BASI|nr:2-dehydropantoate 2-reductase [Malassezia obtusa]